MGKQAEGIWSGPSLPYSTPGPFIGQAPTVLGITPVEFPYTARIEAANFKFSKRRGLWGTIGHHWQQSQALARSRAIALCLLMIDGDR